MLLLLESILKIEKIVFSIFKIKIVFSKLYFAQHWQAIM